MTVVPEAQLQAHVLALLPAILPHVNPCSFSVETRFKLKLGHSEQDHNGEALWEAEGRADLIVYHEGRPLAVFELKREDKSLTPKDLEQGQSYAAVMSPRPPLVIVSNGEKETWVRQAENGEPLDPDTEGAGFVEKLFENLGKVAAASNAWAIDVLMGPETRVWVEAVRQRTDSQIERMTGAPDDMRKPFAQGVLFHRFATDALLDRLAHGARSIIVEGPPLSGKSNVLREFAVVTRDSNEWAVLLINGAAAGPGLFQRIANLLGAALEWKLSADDVRAWLRRMSQSSRRPSLVLTIDGLVPGSPIATDIEELAESEFGPGLCIVASVDRADDVLHTQGGRGETAWSMMAEIVPLGPLDDDEFEMVREELAGQRIFFYPGSELSEEYRTAWVLRSVLTAGEAPKDESLGTAIPASMGLGIVGSARARMASLHETAHLHRLVARDAIAYENSPAPELALAQANAFVVRRDALSDRGSDAIAKLEARGWVSFYRHPGGEDVAAFRVPEFFMSELALEMAERLQTVPQADVEDAGPWLSMQSGRFFLGDIIGAQALVDLFTRTKSIPHEILEFLMNDPPATESIAGKVIGIENADGGITNYRFDAHGGVALADERGNAVSPFLPLKAGEDMGVMHGNTTSWLLLSQLARVRSSFGKTIEDRFDIDIILHVGRCDFPLMRGGSMVAPKAQMIHELGSHGSVLSVDHALAEPLTSAINKLFAAEWRDLDFFFGRLVEANSLPLTVRVHNALAPLRRLAAPGIDTWLADKMRSIIHPLMREQMEPAS